MAHADGLKVGAVAEHTGLSIRTLRHYDEVGLLTPSTRLPSGYRLYSADDVERLLLIRRMKPLGFSLQEMSELLSAVDSAEEGSSGGAATIRAFVQRAEARRRELERDVGYVREFLDLLTSRTPHPGECGTD